MKANVITCQKPDPWNTPLQPMTGESSGIHPVFQTSYHRRMKYDGEFCRFCLHDKVSIDTRFQGAFPFCERCGMSWIDPFRKEQVPTNVITVWDEETENGA